MKTRMLAVLLALPLLAFDCGGEEKTLDPFGGLNPFGLGCTLHVGGAVPQEDLWCVVSAYDYSAFPDPQLASTTWAFVISGYRQTFDVGAGGGIFLDGRPTVGVTYWWSGDAASSALASGGFNRYAGSMSAGTYVLTHASSSLGTGSGTGSFSVTFSAIPAPNATDADLLGVHGTFTATLPPVLQGGGNVALTATF